MSRSGCDVRNDLIAHLDRAPNTLMQLYLRHNCLCSRAARELVESLLGDVPTMLVEHNEQLPRDIATRELPILVIDGRARMWGKFDRVVLARLVRAATGLPQ